MNLKTLWRPVKRLFQTLWGRVKCAFGKHGRRRRVLIDTHEWLVCPRCTDHKVAKAKAATIA